MKNLAVEKVACLSHVRYYGVLLWNEIAVYRLSVAMWFGTCSCLGMGIRTCGLVRPLFLAKTTWFGKPDFCNTEEEWARNGVEDHEASDDNDV